VAETPHRYSIHGHRLTGRVFTSKCHDCGMPTISPDEFHPYAACEAFRETHDSREVERVIEPLFRRHLLSLKARGTAEARRG
jgi:hypothetical protein